MIIGVLPLNYMPMIILISASSSTNRRKPIIESCATIPKFCVLIAATRGVEPLTALLTVMYSTN